MLPGCPVLAGNWNPWPDLYLITNTELSPEDRFAVMEYIKTFSERFSNPNEYPLKVIEPANQ
ncbi:MAG: hypothetical protein ACK4GQ_01820, partial [Candidatus Hadarchaeales archaeon]